MGKLVSALALAAALAIWNAPLAAQAPGSSMKKIELPPDNAMSTLKPGPGVDTVKSDCMICHSTDYIVRQPGGDAKHWEPEVRKMIKVYGAPIPEADVQSIVNYLAAAYPAEPARSASTAAPSSERPAGHEHIR